MSLSVIKAGLLDTIQDLGRTGYRHWGINPTGALDRFALQVANLLVGNDRGEAGLEMFFPAPTLLFEEDALIAIAGADIGPVMNGQSLPTHTPIWVRKGSLLHFEHLREGYCAYLAIRGGLDIPVWLGSRSTHLKAGAGGWKGRALKPGDRIGFRHPSDYHPDWGSRHHISLPFKAAPWRDPLPADVVGATRGPEWEQLEESSKQQLEAARFTLTVPADRMGFRLRGEELLRRNQHGEMVSAAVDFGTLQLLPNGQAIILLADHQTTGGYPRIGRIIQSHHHRLVQKRPGETIRFQWIQPQEALASCILQEEHLRTLQIACILKLEETLYPA